MLYEKKIPIPDKFHGDLVTLSRFDQSIGRYQLAQILAFSLNYIFVAVVIIQIARFISYQILGPYETVRLMLPINMLAIMSYPVFLIGHVLPKSMDSYSENRKEQIKAEFTLAKNYAVCIKLIVDSKTFAMPHDYGVVIVTESEQGGTTILGFSHSENDYPAVFEDFENFPSFMDWLEMPGQDQLIDQSYSDKSTKLRCRYFDNLDLYMMLRVNSNMGLWRLKLDETPESIERRLMTAPSYAGSN